MKSDKRQLLKIYERDRGICGFCGLFVEKKDATRGHIIPLSHGGRTTYDNLVLEHAACNNFHGDIPLGVDLMEYSLQIWEELFVGKKVKTNTLIWALNYLKKVGNAEISVKADEALKVIKHNRVGSTVKVHGKNNCTGLISSSKTKYEVTTRYFPCTLCGEEK